MIGDSISAGIGNRDEQTWPKILRQKYKIEVIDVSVAGATVNSALKHQANQVKSDNSIVLLEIGGNDLFAPTQPKMFMKDLEQILKTVSGPNRTVIMLELPLLPWQIQYGRIQRKVARQHNTILIPKCFLTTIFGNEQTTVDLAHLSPTGHKLLAEKVWDLIGHTFSKQTD